MKDLAFILKAINNDENIPKEINTFRNVLNQKFKNYIDCKLLASHFYKSSDLHEKGLVALIEIFNLPVKQAHNSGFDAEMALSLFNYFKDKLPYLEKFKNSLYNL